MKRLGEIKVKKHEVQTDEEMKGLLEAEREKILRSVFLWWSV